MWFIELKKKIAAIVVTRAMKDNLHLQLWSLVLTSCLQHVLNHKQSSANWWARDVDTDVSSFKVGLLKCLKAEAPKVLLVCDTNELQPAQVEFNNS